MALIKDTAIVLRRLDYSETSQVLALFTRDHGQQRLIAKGIKRSTKTRVAVGVDLLEWGDLVFSAHLDKPDNLGILTEWKQRDGFLHLRRDLGRCYAAMYAAEATSHLTEIHDPHPPLFDALCELCHALADHDPRIALIAYLWTMLQEVGLLPELSRCVACGRSVGGDTMLYFSSRRGGAICRDCEPAEIEKRRISPHAMRVFSSSEHAPHADHTDHAASVHRPHESDLGNRTGHAEGVHRADDSHRANPTDHAAVLNDAAHATRRTTSHPLAARAAFEVLDYHLTETIGHPLRLAAPLRDAWLLISAEPGPATK